MRSSQGETATLIDLPSLENAKSSDDDAENIFRAAGEWKAIGRKNHRVKFVTWEAHLLIDQKSVGATNGGVGQPSGEALVEKAPDLTRPKADGSANCPTDRDGDQS